MKKKIIMLIAMMVIISIPVLSQSQATQNVNVTVTCPGGSEMYPESVLPSENLGTIQAGGDFQDVGPVEVKWRFEGDGTNNPRQFDIVLWQQAVEPDPINYPQEKVEIQSQWYADGNGTPKELITSPMQGGRYQVYLNQGGGCDSWGYIYLVITKAKATEHFPSNMGPVVFKFTIDVVD